MVRQEYSYGSNGDCRFSSAGGVASPPHYHDSYYERPDRYVYLCNQPTRNHCWVRLSAAQYRRWTSYITLANANLGKKKDN